MSKLAWYDEVRELYLAKVHDGHGTLYIMNIPPGTKLTARQVLTAGEIISIREKGTNFRRIDSSSDGNSRSYQKITPLEPNDIDPAELQAILAEKRKTAPIPGEWTQRPAPTPDVEPPATTSQAVKTYKGEPVLSDKHGPYLAAKKACHFCGKEIPGRRTISVDKDGKFTRLQNFVASVVAKPISQKSPQMACIDCLSKIDPTYIPEIPAPIVVPPGTKEIKTPVGTFHQLDNDFYYKGMKLLFEGNQYRYYHNETCNKCHAPIPMKATVNMHEGLPRFVGQNKPIGQKLARPVKPRSSLWLCESCVLGKPIRKEEPAQADVQEPVEEKVEAQQPVEKAVYIPEPPAKKMPLYVMTSNNAVKKLEEMAMDLAIEDKVFRGAAWMLCRAMGGES